MTLQPSEHDIIAVNMTRPQWVRSLEWQAGLLAQVRACMHVSLGQATTPVATNDPARSCRETVALNSNEERTPADGILVGNPLDPCWGMVGMIAKLTGVRCEFLRLGLVEAPPMVT